MISLPPWIPLWIKCNARLNGIKANGTVVVGMEPLPRTVVPLEPGLDEKPEQPLVVRRKEFTLVPMDEAEAVEQMALLGHENFFIFYNANSSQINILYRRRDGTYGLIEPKIG